MHTHGRIPTSGKAWLLITSLAVPYHVVLSAPAQPKADDAQVSTKPSEQPTQK